MRDLILNAISEAGGTLSLSELANQLCEDASSSSNCYKNISRKCSSLSDEGLVFKTIVEGKTQYTLTKPVEKPKLEAVYLMPEPEWHEGDGLVRWHYYDAPEGHRCLWSCNSVGFKEFGQDPLENEYHSDPKLNRIEHLKRKWVELHDIGHMRQGKEHTAFSIGLEPIRVSGHIPAIDQAGLILWKSWPEWDKLDNELTYNRARNVIAAARKSYPEYIAPWRVISPASAKLHNIKVAKIFDWRWRPGYSPGDPRGPDQKLAAQAEREHWLLAGGVLREKRKVIFAPLWGGAES